MRTGLVVRGVVLLVLGLIGSFIGFGSFESFNLATQLDDRVCTGVFPGEGCPLVLVAFISLIVTVVGSILLILGIVLRKPKEETRPA